MTDEQFDKLYKLFESMDWKLWEIHNMIKNVLSENLDEGAVEENDN